MSHPTWHVLAAYTQPVPEDWQAQLALLLGYKPRRLSRWCELGLFGALQCTQAAGRPLGEQTLIRVFSQFGTLAATGKALAQVQDFLPMPFTFMQTQPGQLLTALGLALQWRGDGCVLTCSSAQAEAQLLHSLRGPCLLGWVDEQEALISRWLWLEPRAETQGEQADGLPQPPVGANRLVVTVEEMLSAQGRLG